MFIRNEPFRFFLKHYPVTSLILAVNLLIFLVLYISGTWHVAPVFAYNVFQFMVGSNAMILQGAWWQLITPIFLHISFSHFLFNAFSIFLFAPALEALLGRLKFLLAFLGTGIIANIAVLFLESPGFSHNGASGAVFGLFGIYLYLVIFRKELIPRPDQTIIIVLLVLGLIGSFLYPNIDIKGHLTGFLAGLALAPLLFLNVRFRSSRK